MTFFVKNVPYNFTELDDDDRDFSRNRKRAEELGRECAQHWSIFEKVAVNLSRGETRESAAFGRAFLEATDRPAEAIEVALRELERADVPNQSLLGGMLFALFERDPLEVQNILSRVSHSSKLREFLPYFTSLHLTPDGLSLVIDALDRGELPPAAASIFGMGGVLKALPVLDVRRLITSLISLGPDGAWVAVDLLSMYLHSDQSRLHEVSEEINSALRAAPIFMEKADLTMASYHYETLAKGLLSNTKYGPSFAAFLADQVIKNAKETGSSDRGLPRKIAELLLTLHPTSTLPVFASHIEQSDRTDRWFFSYILGTPFSFDGKHEGPLFKIGCEAIIAACKSYPKNFAVMVAEVAPLFSAGDGPKKWTEIGKALLDKFGARKDILHALTLNIGSGGWSGPTSSYLQTFINPLEEIKDHPIRQVRSWARDRLKGLRHQIERELRDEEEEALRRS